MIHDLDSSEFGKPTAHLGETRVARLLKSVARVWPDKPVHIGINMDHTTFARQGYNGSTFPRFLHF